MAVLNVGGLRTGAGALTDAGSERPTGQGDRRAEQGGHPCVAQLASSYSNITVCAPCVTARGQGGGPSRGPAPRQWIIRHPSEGIVPV